MLDSRLHALVLEIEYLTAINENNNYGVNSVYFPPNKVATDAIKP